MYNDITKIIKQNGGPWNYNDVMRESLQYLKTKYPDKINSYYLNNPPTKFEDLISYTDSTPNISGKENVFSEMGKLRNQILKKMDKAQLEALYKEFKKTLISIEV